MKKLGLIGGVGPESTISYYHGLVYGVQKRVAKPFFPNLTIESLSSFDVISMSSEGKYAELADYLMAGIKILAASGVDFAALACNTGHIVFDKLQAHSPIPLISIVDATCVEAKKRGLTKVGLLGTEATMNHPFFAQPFTDANIKVITPLETEKEYIAQKIQTELELGIVKDDTVSDFLAIIRRMKEEERIQAIILGCTELPLLFQHVELPIACLDTMQIHIETLIDKILED